MYKPQNTYLRYKISKLNNKYVFTLFVLSQKTDPVPVNNKTTNTWYVDFR